LTAKILLKSRIVEDSPIEPMLVWADCRLVAMLIIGPKTIT
jgi:hypothetical protein